MAWRVARSLDTLLAQLNAMAPRRSKVSDGSIGDAAHATRDSDHNPWLTVGEMGIVTARDFTHDPAGGLDCQWLADRLTSRRDPRIKYVIWRRRIWNHAKGWQPYSGVNPHDKHLHLSVVSDAARFDSTAQWDLLTPAAALEDDMPLTDADVNRIAAAVVNRDIVGDDDLWMVIRRIDARQAELAKAIAELAARIKP